MLWPQQFPSHLRSQPYVALRDHVNPLSRHAFPSGLAVARGGRPRLVVAKSSTAGENERNKPQLDRWVAG